MALVGYLRFTSTVPLKASPAYLFIPSSLSNCLSSWAQYEALKYLTFPTQTISKCCKIIPVMLMGVLLNKKSYKTIEYFEALVITAGVGMFALSGDSKEDPSLPKHDSSLGLMLIAAYLLCDSFTSQWQSRVFKNFGLHQFQMQLGTNVWSLVLTGTALIWSGEGVASLGLLLQDSSAMWDNIVLSITSAIGQLFIFYTIKEFGAKTFTIMMTTRQMFSMIISCVIFLHPVGLLSWMGAAIVFAIVFHRIYIRGGD